MKPILFFILICASTACFTEISGAVVVQTPGIIKVEGFLNGGIIAPDITGDTLDYLKFEVLTTTSITITSEFNSALFLHLAQFIGRDDEFGFVGNPYYLVQESSTEWDFFTRTLDPGIYVIAMGVRRNTSYDIFDGFQAVNPEGGGFTSGEYAYSIEGDVRAAEFWDGELDGSFKITIIPEPSATALCGLAAMAVGFRKRKT